MARSRRGWAAVWVLTLITSGCGARLTKAQQEALDSPGYAAQGAGGSQSAAPSPVAGGANQSPGVTVPTSGSSTGSVPSGGSAVGAPGSAATGAAGPSAGPGPNAGTRAPGVAAPVSPVAPVLAGAGGATCRPGTVSHDPGVTASSITLGNIATVNGPVPGLFVGARFGTQAVVDYINSLGGLCGRQLTLLSEDDQFDQATDQQEAASMAPNVLSFVGSFSLQDSGIPSGAPDVPDIGESLSSQRFNAATNFSPQPQAPGYRTGEYKFLASDPRYHTATQHMALLIDDTPSNEALGQAEKAALESVGYKFVFVDTQLQPTDPTFNNDPQKMKSAGVQGVIFQSTGTIIGQLANQLYSSGLTLVLGNYCPSAYDPAYIANAGPGVAGTAITQSMSLFEGEDAGQIPMVATFDQWYARVNPGQVPDLYAAYAWMSGIMLAQAINSGGAPTRSALLAGLRQQTSFTGDGMGAPSNPAAKTPATCFILVHVQNGRFARDPATPSGFRCTPTGYFHAP